LENTSIPVSVTKPLLYRLNADLCKFGVGILETPIPWKTVKTIREAGQPTPPPGVSRFALLKLILNRNRKEGEPVIQPQVFETDDAAYNCGRLLATFDDLQMAAHEWELEGAGVVERYYGSASSAPNSAFGILWRLHQHHLRKLSQQGEKGRAAAAAVKRRIGEICSMFSQGQPGMPPEFPRIFTLTEQGRFAIGFYQQKAADDAARKGHTKNRQNAENQTSREEETK
jgi:CRISPR-associated protein Csd1